MKLSSRTRTVLAAAVFISSLGFGSPGGAEGQAVAQDVLAQASQLLQGGRFKAAEEILERELRLGANGQAEYLMGFALINLYRFEEAEEHLRRAVADQPASVDRLHTLAKSLLEQGKNVAAVEVLDRAIAVKPRADLYFARAMCNMNAGRSEAAERDLAASLAAAPRNPEALFKLGQLALDRGDYDGGRARFRACLEINPGHLEARFFMGVAELRSGEAATSIANFEWVLARVPGHVGALYNVARAYRQSGRAAEAQSALETFKRVSAAQDDVDFLRHAVQKNPNNVDGRIVLAQKLLEVGRAEDALREALVARQLDPKRADTYRVLAEALGRLGREQDARQAIDFATRLDGASE